MKRKIDFLIVALFAVVLFASCERVAPNYAGVLMENYGKQGKEDFKIVAGKVSTWELGTELFQVVQLPTGVERGAVCTGNGLRKCVDIAAALLPCPSSVQ